MTKEEIKKQKWDVLNFLEENATLTVGECLVKYSDQQTKELQKEVDYWQTDRNEINAMWTRRYNSQKENEDILRERKNGHIKVLYEEITQLTTKLEEANKEVERLKEGVEGIERTCDVLNPFHQGIWEIANELLNK